MKTSLFCIIIVLAITSCSVISAIVPFVTGVITFNNYYDLDNNEQIPIAGGDTVRADIMLVAESDEYGNPAPLMSHCANGDQSAYIVELGAMSLQEGMKVRDEYIEFRDKCWQVYPTEGHSYYICTQGQNEFILYVSGVEIEEANDQYECSVYFDFKLR